MQRQLNQQFSAGQGDHPVNGYIIRDDESGVAASAGPSGGI